MGYSFVRPTGTTYHDPARAYPGYTLFTSLSGDTTYLIAMDGEVTHTWSAPAGWKAFYGELLENGNLLLRGATGHETWNHGGVSGGLVELNWDGREVWRYQDPSLHHDHCRLRNGNTLVLGWEPLPQEVQWRVQGGLSDTESDDGRGMVGDYLREVAADGRTVWEWHAYNALDPAQDVICPLEQRLEWTHGNAVEELPDGRILVSFRLIDTIGIIDRATGRFTWKWGRGLISHQHDPSRLANGNLLLFDNGAHRAGNSRSRVVEVNPRSDEVVWQFVGSPQASFFSFNISGAQRLPNGNTLVCEGASGRFFEVTNEGELVWEYANPYVFRHRDEPRSSAVFRAHRYAADSPQLRNRI